jgi:hypothetical protein
MAATVEIDEANGVGETITHGITNSNMGSVDSANLNPANNSIDPGNHSYEKWQKIHVTNMGGASKLDNFKVYRVGALNGAAVHKTNLQNPPVNTAYTTPTSGTPNAALSQTMPSSEPASTNLGVSAGTGGLTATGSTDYAAHQLQVDPADTAGNTTQMAYQWDEHA